MVITISADSWLKFPMTDEVLAEAVNPLWDVITKVYRGKDAPIDHAVQRYFSLCRPVRIVPSFSSRVQRADLHIVLFGNLDTLSLLIGGNETATYYYHYDGKRAQEIYEIPF